MPRTYYCVTSVFNDRGRVTSAITAKVRADTKPADSFRETPSSDTYEDWFSSRKAAEAFVEEAKNA